MPDFTIRKLPKVDKINFLTTQVHWSKTVPGEDGWHKSTLAVPGENVCTLSKYLQLHKTLPNLVQSGVILPNPKPRHMLPNYSFKNFPKFGKIYFGTAKVVDLCRENVTIVQNFLTKTR